MTKKIQIDLKDQYLNIKYKTGLMFVFYLRYLFFCDQCHDFCEKADRNMWKDNNEYVFEKLVDSYLEDIVWLKQQLENKFDEDFDDELLLAFLTTLYIPISNEYTEKQEIKTKLIKQKSDFFDTSKLIKQIDIISTDYFNVDFLRTIPREETEFACSQLSNRLFNILNKSNEQYKTLSNKFILSVDADKSTFNMGSILFSICDQMYLDKDNFHLILPNTLSKEYDSASGSGSINYLTSIRQIFQSDKTEIKEQLDDNVNIIVKFHNIQLLDFTYTKAQKESNDISNLKHLNKILFSSGIDAINLDIINTILNKKLLNKLLKYVSEIYPRIKISTKWDTIDDNKIFFVQLHKYIRDNTKHDKIDDNETKILNKINSESQNKMKTIYKLNIDQFYKKKAFGIFNGKIDSTNSSVKELTSNYTFDSSALPNVVCYKTLGDFGQICEFYGRYVMDKNYTEYKKIFITLDKICSRISSFFIPYTILEDLSNTQNPISSFMYRLSGVPAKLRLKEITREDLQQVNFGRKLIKKEHDNKIININIKKMGLTKYVKNFSLNKKIKLIKQLKHFSKKYRIPEDKNIIKNLKQLNNLHKKAKKLKINITKKHRSGKRIYLTIDELDKKIKKK